MRGFSGAGARARDDVTSSTGSGSAAAGQQGAVAFATTHWSLVLEAQGESPAAQEALEKLCRIYWRPVYSFLRRQGVAQEEAEDLTQGFFALLLERGDFSAVHREKGRLRSYLLTALNLLKDEYAATRNPALFDSLTQLLPDEPGAPSRADIAAQFGMTENAVTQAFHRFRRRYQSLLREEIAHTVATPGDIDDELSHLIAVIRA